MQHQQRQINLLDHIDAVQDEVSHRMDFIERELDGKTCGSSSLVINSVFSAGWETFKILFQMIRRSDLKW